MDLPVYLRRHSSGQIVLFALESAHKAAAVHRVMLHGEYDSLMCISIPIAAPLLT
jgi:hypothetical protein